MNITILYAITSVILVSLVSLVGIVTTLFIREKTDHLLFILVSTSAGTLFGGAFFHLIPEATGELGEFSITLSFQILSGIIVFFVLDKLIHWKHAHNEPLLIHTKEKKNTGIAYMNLLGDGVHNLLDGLVIAGSYLVSIPIGIATTLAVVIHETPQEIADFGVLIYSGFSKKRALLFNLLSASLAMLGVIIGLTFGARSESFIAAIVPFAGGAFIYIAGSNLIPELLRENRGIKDLLQQVLAIMLGVSIMYGLLFIEQ